jgi:3-oxoacyl-[acyl-carrier protein] reductase
MSKLAGKVAVVTGASKGIGAAIAERLAADGAAVIVNYASSPEGADAIVAKIKAAGGKAKAVGADVSKPAEAKRLVAAAVSEFGRLDILVNNAGVYEFAPLPDVTEKQFDRMFNLNVKGVVFATQAASSAFGDQGGAVVNIGSVASLLAPAGGSVYSATKGALDVLTRSLASELGPRKIFVNAVLPGPVETEGGRNMPEFNQILNATLPRTPFGRVGQPEDIASAVSLLVSDDAHWITGQIIQAAGGLH